MAETLTIPAEIVVLRNITATLIDDSIPVAAVVKHTGKQVWKELYREILARLVGQIRYLRRRDREIENAHVYLSINSIRRHIKREVHVTESLLTNIGVQSTPTYGETYGEVESVYYSLKLLYGVNTQKLVLPTRKVDTADDVVIDVNEDEDNILTKQLVFPMLVCSEPRQKRTIHI